MLILHPCAPITISKLRFSATQSHRSNPVASFPSISLSLRAAHSRSSNGEASLKCRAQSAQGSPGVEDQLYDDDQYEEGDGFATRTGGFSGRDDDKDYDKDPEFAEILGSCLDDPQKAQSRVSSLYILISIFFLLIYLFCNSLKLRNDY